MHRSQVYSKKKGDETEQRLSSSLSRSRQKKLLPPDLKTRKIMTMSKLNSGLASMVVFDNLSNKTLQVPTYNEYILQLGE